MISRLILALTFMGLTFLAAGSAAAQDRTVWNVSLWGQPREFTHHVEQLAKTVRLRTKGQFVLNLNYGGLSKPRQNLEGIANGSFQMAQFCVGYHPEKTPALSVLELPFLGVATLEQELAVSQAVYAHPAAQVEMARWNAVVLMPTPLPQYNLVGRGAPPETTDWFRGKRIRATGGTGRILAAFGAEPVALTAPETRKAFASGEIDAVAFAPHAHFAFDTISPAEWWTTNLDPGTVNCPVVVNADALAALPEAHRSVLMGAVSPALTSYVEIYKDLMDKWATVLEVFDKAAIQLDDSVIAAMRADAPAEVARQWAAEVSAAQVPAGALLSLVERALTSAPD